MERINNALFCDKCSLQFDKKIVYDIHLSFVHKISGKLESEEKTIEIKEEDSSSVFQSDNKKTIQNLDSIEKWNKTRKSSMCDYTLKNKGHLKKPLNQFMKERNHTSVQFVITEVQQSGI